MKLVGLIVVFLALASAARAAPETKAAFDVMAFGVKVGEMHLNGSMNRSRYATSVLMFTTGLARQVKDVRFSMSAAGKRSGARFTPKKYAEEVRTGSRQSSSQMVYRNGVPSVVAGDIGDKANALDPSTQRGTVDPLTALYLVLRDQPEGEACALDQPVFDGARRTQIVLNAARRDGDKLHCSGAFLRVDGYSDKHRRQGMKFPIQITYALRPGQDAIMGVERTVLETIHGKVTLVRH